MSDEEVKGKIEKSKGKIREEIGKITGNKSEQIKGKAEQVKGKVQEEIGKPREKHRITLSTQRLKQTIKCILEKTSSSFYYTIKQTA
jgi:uncharacterized protein YjbJ (UPF0337 family)